MQNNGVGLGSLLFPPRGHFVQHTSVVLKAIFFQGRQSKPRANLAKNYSSNQRKLQCVVSIRCMGVNEYLCIWAVWLPRDRGGPLKYHH